MKSIRPILTLIIVLITVAFPVFAQNHYVVIGAFANEANALRFTGNARKMNLDAIYQFNPDRNLFYVHIMKTERKEEASNWSIYLQRQTQFKGTWVFSETNQKRAAFMSPNQIAIPSLEFISSSDSKERLIVSAGKDLTFLAPIRRSLDIDSDVPVENKITENVIPADKVTEDNVVENSVFETSVAETNVENNSAEKISLPWIETWSNIEDISVIRNLPESPAIQEKINQSSGKVLTCIIETVDGKNISGEAMVVNNESHLSLLSFKPGEKFAIKADSKNKMITVVCDIFGYREELKTFNLDNPLRAKGIKRNEQGVLEIRFQLARLKKLDISIMYNVSFLKDAAIMK